MQRSYAKSRICFITTNPITVNAFLLSHLAALSKWYDVTVITNVASAEFLELKGIPATVIPLRIERQIHLFADLRALLRLTKLIKQQQFTSVHSVTPKAGLLAMIASWINKVPLRVHTYTGQVWANKSGFKRWFLKGIDRFFGKLATHTMVDSPSQRDFLLAEKVLVPEKCVVFGKGSISGVDLSKFKPNLSKRQSLRQEFKVSEEAVVCLFLGRLNADKGVLDLAKAFINTKLQLKEREAVLLFVGPDEQGMRGQIEVLDSFNVSNIKFIDYTEAPQDFMAAADLLCLPSYREGFGSVIIEAAAVGVPSLASRIYGITDAVDDGRTGLLHTPANVADIQEKLTVLINDNKLRRRLGDSALVRAKTVFDATSVTVAWLDFYKEKVPC